MAFETSTSLDRWLIAADNALRTVSGVAQAGRPSPAAGLDPSLPTDLKRQSAPLMRVNHVGEVCAQALYEAQALTARSPEIRAQMEQASHEETDHLAWTAERLRSLGDRPSLLNPLWYAGAFAIGLVAGRAGDAWSLGFLVETERQVEEHLAGHLNRLPADDHASRAIVAQMKHDEAQHAEAALAAGGAPLPAPVRWLMRGASKVMTTTAHYI
ncbi:2-polyprenyl-3-methyl-6-methoxy-1,4-benzoquinone monooxygenase [Ideonella sp.]|uniref:2-polyprenyl-3-methyl-6-methoxy-1,4-benzoquinone monooxygenase n=1 Tax=Ideonella sp. TaxID=1929293 RepID=UPI0035ADD295